METVNQILENWCFILVGIAIVALAVVICIKWLQKPAAEQIENIKEWLLWAVTEAERELGSSTGQLKLRRVFDAAISRFPWVVALPFSTFSDLVDDALEEMRRLLATNEAIADYVEGDTK